MEEEMATQPSIPAWKIPCSEPGLEGYRPWGHQESDTTEQPNTNI